MPAAKDGGREQRLLRETEEEVRAPVATHRAMVNHPKVNMSVPLSVPKKWRAGSNGVKCFQVKLVGCTWTLQNTSRIFQNTLMSGAITLAIGMLTFHLQKLSCISGVGTTES